MVIDYRFNSLEEDFEAIKSLQEKNLRAALSAKVIEKEGFVTAVYSIGELKSMSGALKHSMAFDHSILAGYVLCMIPEQLSKYPFLLKVLKDGEKNNLSEVDFRIKDSLIIGQVCVAAGYRRRGIL